MLGDSIEKIALVKAGIMKPGCPVLVGPGCPIDILKVRHKLFTLVLISSLIVMTCGSISVTSSFKIVVMHIFWLLLGGSV